MEMVGERGRARVGLKEMRGNKKNTLIPRASPLDTHTRQCKKAGKGRKGELSLAARGCFLCRKERESGDCAERAEKDGRGSIKGVTRGFFFFTRARERHGTFA
jgi:hypothetical protein